MNRGAVDRGDFERAAVDLDIRSSRNHDGNGEGDSARCGKQVHSGSGGAVEGQGSIAADADSLIGRDDEVSDGGVLAEIDISKRGGVRAARGEVDVFG